MRKTVSILTAVLFLGMSGCATMGKNATEVSPKDPSVAHKLVGKTPSQAEAILGPAVMKGFDDGNPRMYQLIYAASGQAPVYDWQLKMKVNNNKRENQDTGVKCVSINFNQEDSYKFQDGGAAIYTDYDCIQFRNLTGEMPK